MNVFVISFDNPAESDYFIRFNIVGIENDKRYGFNLKNKDGLLSDYCGKVFKGETLRNAIKRELYNTFGVEKTLKENYLNDLEAAKNRFREMLPRVIVNIEIDKKQIKVNHFNDDIVNWTEEKIIKFKEDSEALEWLQKEKTYLASNRFDNKEEAKLFIKKLYESGAVKVEVENIIEDDSGEEYTANLVIKLPDNPELREKLFAISKEETEREFPGEYREKDEGQKIIEFWWD